MNLYDKLPLKEKNFNVVVDTKYPNIVRQVHPYIQKYIDDIIDTAKDCDIDRLWLFGSAITEVYRLGYSDIDLAVEGDSDLQFELYKKLSKLLGPNQEYDLIDVSHYSGRMLASINRGVLLYEKDFNKSCNN